MKLPPPKPRGGRAWRTGEVEEIIGAQRGVEGVECERTARVPKNLSAAWVCTVMLGNAQGEIRIMANDREVLSYVENRVPGLVFGR